MAGPLKHVRVLTNKDMEGLFTMAECIEVIEEAYKELGLGIAQVIARRRIHLPLPGNEDPHYFWLNVIPGAVPKYDTADVRLDAAQVNFHRGHRMGDGMGQLAGAEKYIVFPGNVGDAQAITAVVTSLRHTT